jgi:hypothetical protein
VKAAATSKHPALLAVFGAECYRSGGTICALAHAPSVFERQHHFDVNQHQAMVQAC